MATKRQSVRTLLPAIQRDADPIMVAEALGILQDQTDLLSKATASVAAASSSSAPVSDVLIASPTGLSATASTVATDGVLSVVITGTLPVDANMAGLRFIVEVPAPGDPDAENLTLPGVLLNDVPDWYTDGDGSEFSQTITIPKPAGLQRILIYALPFAEGYENPLVRLTQHDPPLPANVTAYAVINIGATLTIPGSELGDVTVAGAPVTSATGLGRLRISGKYAPPYLAGPEPAIGDFQGVDVWYEDETGAVDKIRDFPYLPPVGPGAPPPDNLGSISVDVPMPTEGSTVYLTLCSYSTTKRLPYRPRSTAPSTIVITVTVTSATIAADLATQISGFNVTVSSPVVAGGDNSGVRTQHYIYSGTPPADSKWRGVHIWRFQSIGPPTWALVPGGVQGNVAGLTVLPGFSGDFSMPGNVEYWVFEARSMNAADVENTVSAPRVFVTLTPFGELVNAAASITAAMLQDLAVEARALADYAVQTRNYAPLSIVSAAIGIAAINDANIANLSLGKLTPVAGSATIEASGGLIFKGGGQLVGITASGVETNGSIISYGGLACQGTSILTYGAGTPDFIVGSGGVQINRFASPSSVIASLLPGYGGHSGQFLKTDGSGLMWDTPGGSTSGVSSFIGRTGAVVAATGDYSASQISGLGTAATANLGTGGSDAAYGNHAHSGVYAPADYYPGQSVNNQLYYLTNDLDAGISATVPSTFTSMTFSNGRLVAYT